MCRKRVATELNGIVGELSSLIDRFDRYLSEGVGEDLKARLERLEQAGNDLALLERIEQTVRERGLVEFRSSIAAILDRAEDRELRDCGVWTRQFREILVIERHPRNRCLYPWASRPSRPSRRVSCTPTSPR